MSDQNTERCPGGYLIRGPHLCGRSGNRCVDYCAFAYRGRPDPKPVEAIEVRDMYARRGAAR